MMRFRQPKVIPIILFPGDYCLVCADQEHEGRECPMLEMHPNPDGGQAIVKPCGCKESVTAGMPGKYVLRVTEVQKE